MKVLQKKFTVLQECSIFKYSSRWLCLSDLSIFPVYLQLGTEILFLWDKNDGSSGIAQKIPQAKKTFNFQEFKFSLIFHMILDWPIPLKHSWNIFWEFKMRLKFSINFNMSVNIPSMGKKIWWNWMKKRFEFFSHFYSSWVIGFPSNKFHKLDF